MWSVLKPNAIACNVPVAVIPLTNSRRQLLPVHFLTDPGEEFDWQASNLSPDLMQEPDLSTEQKIDLLKQYLDVEQVTIRQAGVLFRWDLCRKQLMKWHNANESGYLCIQQVTRLVFNSTVNSTYIT